MSDSTVMIDVHMVRAESGAGPGPGVRFLFLGSRFLKEYLDLCRIPAT